MKADAAVSVGKTRTVTRSPTELGEATSKGNWYLLTFQMLGNTSVCVKRHTRMCIGACLRPGKDLHQVL